MVSLPFVMRRTSLALKGALVNSESEESAHETVEIVGELGDVLGLLGALRSADRRNAKKKKGGN